MVRRRKDSGALLAEATKVADAIHQQDRAAEAKMEQEVRAQRTSMPIDMIQPRAFDSRPLREKHVAELAESIAALGLIEPLAIDRNGVLLAGGHRLAAIQALKEIHTAIYQQLFPGDRIPVRVMDFDAEAEPERSLQIELAENEKRQNYTRDQIEQLADRLRSLNYKDTRGRPKEGEKALGPALAVAIGVSTRYVRKVLSEKAGGKQLSENRNSDPIFREIKLLEKVELALLDLSKVENSEDRTTNEQALMKAIPGFLKKIQSCLREKAKTIDL